MKYIILTIVVLGASLGGYAYSTKTIEYKAPVKDSPIVVEDKGQDIGQVIRQEPTEEELRLSELMKVKEQEARLEVKRDMQKEELATKSAEYKQKLSELQSEFDAYVKDKNAEIKETEAELASFMKATAVSKN